MSGFGNIFTKRKEGPITKALHEGLKLRAQMIADGTSAAEVDRIVGEGLKSVLENPRGQVWRFLCSHCHDTGSVNVTPSEEERHRLIQTYGDTPQYQGYVVKCDPCRWTEREREKRPKQLGADEDSGLVAAGRTKRSRR